ncbi:MAG TPA: FHA domain-containing protein [Pseudomonadota bacterium]|jgi:pSer/pThr/pTyr-binding forkhead associated (FHA) protein/RNA polymerase subunit RPABC4/transcription elongation factor Spt4|nr:FHA domain-containing protein [Deltaproteobacteria bacterium]HPH26663.1 FHA domain-containing protein [Pseudomonadota bacterium]
MTLGLVCDACDTLSPLSATVCPVCSAPLGVKAAVAVAAVAGPRTCPSCSNEVPAQHRFCGFCGTRVEGAEQRPLWPTASTQSRARLVLIKGEGQDGVAFPILEHGDHVSGRLEGGIMFPEDPLLSPRHATFFFREGKLYVRDDGSRNGVYIRLQKPKVVTTGTQLLIGEQLLRVDACPPEQVPVPDAEGTYFYSSPHRSAKLSLVQQLVGGEVGLVYRARGDTVVIGREGNDVNFPEDPFISGRHAQILALDDRRFQITDLGSKNGTYEKVPTLMQLFAGDHVFLGQQLLRVEM